MATTEEITSKSYPAFNGIKILKGQLYNLDSDEFLGFQFNPQTFVWGRESMWNPSTFLGDMSGGDLSYIRIGAREFDLNLIFRADPSAPDVQIRIEEGQPILNSVSSNLSMDFQVIRSLIEKWEGMVEGKRRASVIKMIMGPNDFDCVITESSFRLVDFFGRDLTVREAIITLSFREWVRPGIV